MASAYLSLLEEPSEDLQLYSLKALDGIVHHFWADIAEALPKINALSEDRTFPHSKNADLLASKVYYHLNNMEKSLSHALGAADLVDISVSDEYTHTLIKYCIDTYVRLRTDQQAIDERLESIVMHMFERCFQDGEYKQALGIALEARLLGKIRESISRSNNTAEMLDYCFRACLRVVKNLDFRQSVLGELVSLHLAEGKNKDHFQICQILILLNDAKSIASMLDELLSQSDDLLAFQLGFDLCDSCTQDFLAKVRLLLNNSSSSGDRLRTILDGKLSVELHLAFLCRNNKTDLAILKNLRESVEPRNLVCHNATVFANALMHAGTTKDGFLRDNLEWLQKATNWSRFSATAGLGVIHKGHMKSGMALLKPYLPTSPPASPYSEGGSLFGIGLIHANHGGDVTPFLLEELSKARAAAHAHPQASEVIQHGACLGLGLAAMATGSRDTFDALLDVVKTESAVAGEAAGLAMGLVMLGTSSHDAITEMLDFASKSQHEKIIRGLSVGIALTLYGREEKADAAIEQLASSADAVVRYGGMFGVGMAYCGCPAPAPTARLLHAAVSDVSDDVRRAAVLNLGFLFVGQASQCVKIVSLLASSFNPHVRYGSAMAVGISCAGTGSREAVGLLEPLAKDAVDFVRQGAMVALAMVLIQTSVGESGKVEKVRQMFDASVADKHEETMAKFGAILAIAIINAGGRNVTISPLTSSGYHKNMCAIVGLAVFCQYWYWYPLLHFLSLSFTPIALIGLNADLNMPVWEVTSNAPPSRFAYPPEYKPPQKEAPKKVTTAVLSTTKKAKARAQQRAEERGIGASGEKEKEEKEKEEKEEKEKEEKEKADAAAAPKVEPSFEIKTNPARVTTIQRDFISCDAHSRWQPVKPTLFGIVLLKDVQPSLPVTLVTDAKAEGSGAASVPAAAPVGTPVSNATATIEDVPEKNEAPVPEEFEFDE